MSDAALFVFRINTETKTRSSVKSVEEHTGHTALV